MTSWRPGSKNLITDVTGLLVGNAACEQTKSGVTVLSSQTPFIASVSVLGGAPGSRETELLAPDKLVEEIDALVLSGGSAFGLDAASGVVEVLRENNRGFQVGPVRVPIVPGAIIFDLVNGGDHRWQNNPYPELGREAMQCASTDFDIGTQGAGTGATTGSIKGGLGSASLQLSNGLVVGALVVANPHGHVTAPGSRNFWAAPFEMCAEFGGLGQALEIDPFNVPPNNKFAAYEKLNNSDAPMPPSGQGMNTTLAIVATNAHLSKAQLKRLAVSAHDGMSRAIVPSHTPFDGDLVFSLATGEHDATDIDPVLIGHAAAVCLSRSVARAVYHATVAPADTLPTWQSLYGDS